MNSFLEKIIRPWESLRSSVSERQGRETDLRIKQNIPPMMGRRDALLDLGITMLDDGMLFSLDTSERQLRFAEINRCFRGSAQCSESIIRLLSSPDTASREEKLLTLIRFADGVSNALCGIGSISGDIFVRLESMAAPSLSGRAADGEETLENTALNLVNMLRRYLSLFEDNRKRYRRYALKSFSAANLERYRKAYDSCIRRGGGAKITVS